MRDKGEEFVACGRLDGGGGLWWLIRQGISLRRDPVGYRLMHDTKCPGNASQISPIDIHADRLCPHLQGVARGFRLQDIFASTPTAPVPLIP